MDDYSEIVWQTGLVMVQIFSVWQVWSWWSCNDQFQRKMCDYITNCALNDPVMVKIYGRWWNAVMVVLEWPVSMKMCNYVTNDTLDVSVKVKLHGRWRDVVMLAFYWPNDNEKSLIMFEFILCSSSCLLVWVQLVSSQWSDGIGLDAFMYVLFLMSCVWVSLLAQQLGEFVG